MSVFENIYKLFCPECISVNFKEFKTGTGHTYEYANRHSKCGTDETLCH